MDHNWFGICPFATAQRLIQGKWAIWVLHHLSDGPVRFHTLQRKMPKMTHANLSTQLKQFEAEGIIIHIGNPQIPPKVEYPFGEIGNKFAHVLESIRIWGMEYIEYMQSKSKSKILIQTHDRNILF